ncbi:DUF3089 domain-containing protein [Brevundimonas faecalis]|uniref:DUF3089 domain-containing protein n=1 Tax=Brevundimonas faecalis TaxID=947378 RepID=UPI00361953D3
MKMPSLTLRQWVGYTGFAVVFILVAAVMVWRGDILRAGLDPQVPFQTYEPPKAPDYAKADAWALQDARAADAGKASVFFVHSTTYDGGAEWNGAIDDRRADAYLKRVVIPNYAGPFARAGAISAPRYRQASLYTRLTLREDAREARAFAYGDVKAAFERWLLEHPDGPIVLAGAEQGAELVDRLLHERIIPDPALRRRVAVVYLMDALSPLERFKDFPLCRSRDQANCVVAWGAVEEGDEAELSRRERRALTWNARGQLVNVDRAPTACVNPITGSTEHPKAAARESRGATNATNLEWGVRPPLQSRAVAAECRDGLLRYQRPDSESFRRKGTWADQRKTPPYNLFYADIETDVLARLTAWERG